MHCVDEQKCIEIEKQQQQQQQQQQAKTKQNKTECKSLVRLIHTKELEPFVEKKKQNKIKKIYLFIDIMRYMEIK